MSTGDGIFMQTPIMNEKIIERDGSITWVTSHGEAFYKFYPGRCDLDYWCDGVWVRRPPFDGRFSRPHSP